MKIVALAVAFTVVSCSSVPRICDPQIAHEAGVAEAMRGETLTYGVGAACVEEHRNVFRQHLEAGYQEGRRKYCEAGDVERRAMVAGQAGDPAGFQESRYRICEGGMAELRGAFKRGYAQGLGEFCATPAIIAAGRAQGEAGAPGAFPSDRYSVCRSYGGLKAAYAKGYREGLAKFCGGGDAEARGFREGNSGLPKSLMSERFGVCSGEQRRRIQDSERLGYERGLGQFCGAGNLESEAARDAQDSDQPRLPAKFGVCPKDVTERYREAFAVQRNRVVSSLCNYEKGVERGLNDGAAGRKDTAMPAFCVQNLYAVYFQGYLEGWKQAKRRQCDGEKAYEKGMSDATGGWMMSYTAPPDCPDEFADTMRARYRDGYMQGKAMHATSSAAGQSSSDCTREITSRSGSSDFSRCRESGSTIACYHEIRETCRGHLSGESTTRNFREYTGRCVSSYSDCW